MNILEILQCVATAKYSMRINDRHEACSTLGEELIKVNEALEALQAEAVARDRHDDVFVNRINELLKELDAAKSVKPYRYGPNDPRGAFERVLARGPLSAGPPINDVHIVS